MIRSWRWVSLPLSLFLAGPVLAQAKKPLDKKEAENKLVKAGVIAGELVHIEPSKHSIRVKVGYPKLNVGAYQALQRAQLDLARARDLNARNNALRAIAQHQANLYTTDYTEIPIEAAEKCEVRLPAPKQSFDDMGNVKKLNAKELAALRGKDRMFDGEFSDLTTGQIVQVTLVKQKLPRVAKKDLEENKPQASRIAVLRQPLPRP
jgi:hypothetical protein